MSQIAMRWENNACKKKQAPHCTGYISNNGELFSPQRVRERFLSTLLV
jgi:hypothetical protein